MNTTERFRANCRRMSEASYARLFAALAKDEGHVKKLPKVPSDGGSRGRVTVRQMVIAALEGGPRTRAEIGDAIEKGRSHISAELSQMARAGLVKKDTITDGGIQLPAWSLT